MTKAKYSTFLIVALGTAAAFNAAAGRADPLMGKEPWNFQAVNRSQLAVVLKQVEDPGSGAGGGGTTIVCGGTSGQGGTAGAGSGSAATGNSSCVIVSNSDGSIIDVGQVSDGDQDSDSDAEVKTNNNSSPKGSIDEVAAILGGK